MSEEGSDWSFCYVSSVNVHVSRWLVRRRIESLALIFAWSAALVAVALLWDSTAAFVAIFGSGYGAAIVYQAARHRWWIAGGLLAFGGGILLNIVTAGAGRDARWDDLFGSAA